MFGKDPDAEGGDELKNDRGRHVLHTIHAPAAVTHPSAGPATRLPATARRKAGATSPTEKPFAATAPTARR